MGRNKPWVLEDRDKDSLRKIYREQMSSELRDSGYPVVGEPGPDVLRVSARITAIAPNAPKDDFGSRPAGRSYYITEGGGSIQMAAVFSDAATGDVLAIMKDNKSATSSWGMNNRIANTADVARVFGSWARQFRARLDIIHGGDIASP